MQNQQTREITSAANTNELFVDFEEASKLNSENPFLSILISGSTTGPDCEIPSHLLLLLLFLSVVVIMEI